MISLTPLIQLACRGFGAGGYSYRDRPRTVERESLLRARPLFGTLESHALLSFDCLVSWLFPVCMCSTLGSGSSMLPSFSLPGRDSRPGSRRYEPLATIHRLDVDKRGPKPVSLRVISACLKSGSVVFPVTSAEASEVGINDGITSLRGQAMLLHMLRSE